MEECKTSPEKVQNHNELVSMALRVRMLTDYQHSADKINSSDSVPVEGPVTITISGAPQGLLKMIGSAVFVFLVLGPDTSETRLPKPLDRTPGPLDWRVIGSTRLQRGRLVL